MLRNLISHRPSGLQGRVAGEHNEVSNQSQTEMPDSDVLESVTLDQASPLVGRRSRLKLLAIERLCGRRALTWWAIIVTATWFVWIFSAGFLLNADDVTDHFIWMTSNWDTFWGAYARFVAQQGRPGQILSHILNFLWLPFLRLPGGSIVILLPSLAFPSVLGLYLKRALREAGVLAFAPLTFGLMPLAFHHMPPNSYPWTIYLPLSLILVLRATWPIDQDGLERGFLFSRLALAGLFVFTIEYSIVAGVVCLGSEIAFRWAARDEGDGKAWRLLNGRTRADFAALASAALALLIFREFVFDGSYNQLGTSYAAFAITAAKHLGNAFSQFGADFVEISPDDLAHALWIAVPLTLFCALPIARPPGGNLSLKSALFGLFWAVSFVLVVSLPAAKQDWCLRGDCVYLDSRLAFYGFVIGLTYLLQRANSAFPTRFRVAANFVVLLFPVALTVVHNRAEARRMADYSLAWRRAQLAFCAGGPGAVRQAAVEGRFSSVPLHLMGSFAGVEVGPAEYFQAFARETGCPSSNAFLELIARPDTIISPPSPRIWPAVSTGFEFHDNSLRMIGQKASIDLASQMQRDIDLEMEITLAKTAQPLSRGQWKSTSIARRSALYIIPRGERRNSSACPRGCRTSVIYWFPLSILRRRRLEFSSSSIRFSPRPSSLQALTTEIQFGQGIGRSPFSHRLVFVRGVGRVEPRRTGLALFSGSVPRRWPPSFQFYDQRLSGAASGGFKSTRHHLGQWGVAGRTASDGDTEGFDVTVPESVIQQSPQGLTLRFDLPDHNSPARLEQNADARELALGLKTVILRRSP